MRACVAAGALLAGMVLAGAPARAQRLRAARPVTVVLAGGCYWGMDEVFRHVRGVLSVTSGFAVPAPSPSAGTSPVEAVAIVYDPARLSYRRILEVFFTVAHDPTQRDRQGPDVGPEYRSLVFANDAARRRAARATIDSLAAAHAFPRPVVTAIAALEAFRAVDASQQDYAARHPDDPYIVTYDVPRVAALWRRFPSLYRARGG